MYLYLNFFSDWGTLKHEVLQGSVLGPPFFMIYINDLPLRINSVSEPVLFVVNTCIIISRRNFKDFCSVSNLFLSHMIKWFAANNLVLNLVKINVKKFIAKNSSHSTLLFGYKEKYVEETVNTKFLGLQIDNHVNWKKCIEQMIPKLSGACYTIRSMVHTSNINTLPSGHVETRDCYHIRVSAGLVHFSLQGY